MNNILDQLKRWQSLAEKSRHGAAAVDYVTLRNAASEIEQLTKCRRLLREACDEKQNAEDCGSDMYIGPNNNWYAAAREAAGGGE